jgi:hypothetical protein
MSNWWIFMSMLESFAVPLAFAVVIALVLGAVWWVL